MATLDALPDLPMAWLNRLSTSLTAESAARLRSTCKLLQQVVDATWEPVEVEVPPHRRSVPLTWEQIKAQIPPPEPRPSLLDDWEEAEFEEAEEAEQHGRPDQHGCNAYRLQVFGPALTRLTANQAVNLLQGKRLLGFAEVAGLCKLWHLDKYSHVTDRLQALEDITFKNLPVQWPPRAPSGRVAGGGNGSDSGFEGSRMAGGGRGECGWKHGGYVFMGEQRTPMESPYRQHRAEETSWDAAYRSFLPSLREDLFAREPYEFWVSTDDSRLLVTTDSSCRPATPEEVQQFVASDSPDDGDKYDIYLTYPTGAQVYVFLGPVEPRHTGRPKAVTVRAPHGSSNRSSSAALLNPEQDP